MHSIESCFGKETAFHTMHLNGQVFRKITKEPHFENDYTLEKNTHCKGPYIAKDYTLERTKLSKDQSLKKTIPWKEPYLGKGHALQGTISLESPKLLKRVFLGKDHTLAKDYTLERTEKDHVYKSHTFDRTPCSVGSWTEKDHKSRA